MKYRITKADGTPVDPRARYFVLRLDDPQKPDNRAARAALTVYAREAYDLAPEAAQAAMGLLAETTARRRPPLREAPDCMDSGPLPER